MDTQLTAQAVQAPTKSLDEWIAQWSSQIEPAQKAVTTRRGLATTLLVIGLIGGCVLLANPGPALAAAVVGIGVFVILRNQANGIQQRSAQQVADEISRTCEAENLQKAKVVEAAFKSWKAGSVYKAVMSALDPETAKILETGKRGLEALTRRTGAKGKAAPAVPDTIQIEVASSSGSVTAVTIKHEDEAEQFRSVALDFLASNAYVEAIAAAGMVAVVYGEIARPGMERVIEITHATDRLKDAVVAAHKVLASFEFKPEQKAILDALIKRRTRSLIELLTAAQQQQTGADTTVGLARAEEIARPFIRDDAFVGAVIDYLGARSTDSLPVIRAMEALSMIPDIRIVPYLLKVFGQMLFYPEGIDAITRLGSDAQAQLLQALRTDGSPNLRFNVALTLGVMEAEAAKPILQELMGRLTNPIERIGCAYGLVRLGETTGLDEITGFLGHTDENINHAAAIAAEHMNQPLDNAVYLRHLSSANRLVRLRLTRKLGAQGTDDPQLIEALIARFDDADESVRSAAVESVSKLGAAHVYDRIADVAQHGSANARACACEVLGKLGDQRAVSLLTEALRRETTVPLRRTILSALGELQAVSALDLIKSYLDNDDLSNAAHWALLRIGLQHADAVKAVLNRRRDKPQKLFVLTVLGDDAAKQKMRGMITSSQNIQDLLQLIEDAMILGDPTFEAPLRGLLKYRRVQNFPGDRYISYMAFKALVRVLLAKS
ncbi:MAG TPA: HEAT repeat domain-containing protein [Anaerolineae bacterium]